MPARAGAGTCTGPGKGANVAVVQDPAIRQALAYAIDRQNLVDTVYAGQATPGNGLISPYYSRFYESYADDPEYGYPHDPEKAQGGARRPAAGRARATTSARRTGSRRKFELMTRVDNTEETNAGKRIKAWAREVGIDIDVQPVTEDAINNKIYASGTKPDTYAPDVRRVPVGLVGRPGHARTSTSRSCAPARRGRTRTTRTPSTTRSRWSRGRRWATTRSASTSCTSPRS